MIQNMGVGFFVGNEILASYIYIGITYNEFLRIPTKQPGYLMECRKGFDSLQRWLEQPEAGTHGTPKLVVRRCFSCSKGKKKSGSILVFGGVGCLPHFPS